jgi:8-oxo-dGTP pyrophosphatase MutT (NUDIX family)
MTNWIASNTPVDSPQLSTLHAEAQAQGRTCLVSAVIVDPAGRAFLQRRSASRRLLPLCWDLVGGHVEPAETLDAALAREVREETGWQVLRLLRLIAVVDWEALEEGQTIRFREFSFVVEVAGELRAPHLEEAKVTECRWVMPSELERLQAEAAEADTEADAAVFALASCGLKLAARLRR